MSELASTEFRRRFAKLTDPTLVTANGHPIGVWTPVSISWKETDGALDVDIKPGRVDPPPGYSHAATQAQRDELLGKINKGRSSL